METAASADVVFFGEEHDDPAGHFLEKEIFKKIDEHLAASPSKKRLLILSMEMFERDIQPVVDEYLKGLITEHHFLKASRPWRNYWTDYRAVVEYARKNELPVVAANAPGRYVNRVSRLGKDALADLSPLAKTWLPPLPYRNASDAYREKFRKFQEAFTSQQKEKKAAEPSASSKKMAKASPHHPAATDKIDFDNLMAAQSLWDASMADSILSSLKKHPGALVFHINGKFHSEQGLGIPEHLNACQPGLKIAVITQMSPAEFPEMPASLKGGGNFIILTDPKL